METSSMSSSCSQWWRAPLRLVEPAPTKRSLPGAFRLADALAQELEEPVGDLGVLFQKRLEVPLGDGRQGDVGVGLDRRAAPLLVEQRHLTKGVARPELPRLALDRGDRNRAIEDDHEANAVFPADHDFVPGRVIDRLHL